MLRLRLDASALIGTQPGSSSHATEVYARHRGKCICVAGEELSVAASPDEVLARARAAHPEDNGSILVRYIPREKGIHLEPGASQKVAFGPQIA